MPVVRPGDEQTLLALADGCYVLSAPDGQVAECGGGVAALCGVEAESAVGRDVFELLAVSNEGGARAELEAALAHGGHAVTGSGGLALLVVPVPLSFGWEFTALLTELGTREPDSWDAAEMRVRHDRAIEAIATVRDAAPDVVAETAGRLAGILIVVRPADAPELHRAEVQRRAQERFAAADAPAEEVPADAPHAPDADGASGFQQLVDQARELRERLAASERAAEEIRHERDELAARLTALREEHERDASGDAAAAERDEALEALAAATAERDEALEALAAATAERDEALEALAAARAERDQAEAGLSAVTVERDDLRRQADELSGRADDAARLEQALRAELAPVADAPPARSQRPDSALPPVASLPGHATVLIGLDGTFERLDDAFCRLLGYTEDDLRSARWPSVIDRDNLDAHRRLADDLKAGRCDSADIETIYMHGHGLLVPVRGTISVVRDAAGAPSHFAFRVVVPAEAGA